MKNLFLAIIVGSIASITASCGKDLSELGDNLFQEKESGMLFFEVARDDYRSSFSDVELEAAESKIRLSDVILKNSWKRLSASYYVDKKRVYYHNSFAMSGTLHIMEKIKPDEFYFYTDRGWRLATELHQDVEKTQWYVSDGKNIFYRGRVLENVDLNTFKVMPKIDGFANGAVAVDKHGFYNLGEKMDVEEVLETIHEFKKSGEIKKEKLASSFETLLAYYKSLQTK